MGSTSEPHDGSYKHLFSHAEMVESLIRDFVPEEWTRDLDFSTLEKQNGSYVTDDLRERHDDIIWRIRCRGEWFYIYLLIEFQSSVDPWMAVRVMTYIGLLYQDLIKSGQIKGGDMLPPVFPLVLYNGREKWTACTDVAELIAPVSSALARYRPNLRYFLLDEGQISDEQLDMDSLAACLIRMERYDGPESLREAIGALKARLRDPKYQSLNRAFTVWVCRVLKNRLAHQESIPDVNDLEEVDTMLAERFGEWTEQIMEKGMLAGLQKGRMEGRMEGRSAVLSRQLAKRFGSDILDSEVQNRLRSADPEQLDLWAERILDARTINEVFAE
jgi:predicted transposase YdaD